MKTTAQRSAFPLSIALAVAACGSPPPPDGPVVAPVASSSAPPSLPSAAASSAPPPMLSDPRLPADVAWAASLDLRRLQAFLPSQALSAIARLLGPSDDITLESIGVDSSRPLVLALGNLSAAQREAVTTITALSSGADAVDAVAKAVASAHSTMTFRVVVPTNNATATRAGIGVFLNALHLKEASDGAFENKESVAMLSDAPGVVVLDAATGELLRDAVASFRAAVAAAPADAPALEGRAIRIAYRPIAMGEIGALGALARTAMFNAMPYSSTADKDRTTAFGLTEMRTWTAETRFERVDMSVRIDETRLSFESRADAAASFAPPPSDAWKSSPSIAADGTTGIFEVAAPFAHAWPPPVLRGQTPIVDPTLQLQPLDLLRQNPAIALPAMWTELAPLSAIAVSKIVPGVADGAYERSERAGYLLRDGKEPIYFLLLPKNASAAATACALSQTVTCPKSERLQVDAVKSVAGQNFAKLVRVKGTSALAVLVTSDQAALGAIHLTSTTAPPLHLSLAPHITLGPKAAFDIPHVPKDARLEGTLTQDGRTIVFKLDAPQVP